MDTPHFQPADFARKFHELRERMNQVIIGQERLVEDLLITVIAGGHALIEGAPGLGKTRLVRSFAALTHLDFGRVQFTPDLMPADITGTTVLQENADKQGLQLEFEKGPIFCHVLLADEINRATPKTQSALLEAMQEASVTISGKHYALPRPFVVLATQNPLEMEGTYPLPEAQLDRFLFKLHIERPSAASLKSILMMTTGKLEPDLSPIFERQELLALQQMLRSVPIASSGLDAVVALIEASHQHPMIRLGASPRGAQAIVLAAKGYALAAGRPNVEFSDIRRASLPALRHRILLSFEAQIEAKQHDSIVQELLDSVPALQA